MGHVVSGVGLCHQVIIIMSHGSSREMFELYGMVMLNDRAYVT